MTPRALNDQASISREKSPALSRSNSPSRRKSARMGTNMRMDEETPLALNPRKAQSVDLALESNYNSSHEPQSEQYSINDTTPNVFIDRGRDAFFDSNRGRGRTREALESLENHIATPFIGRHEYVANEPPSRYRQALNLPPNVHENILAQTPSRLSRFISSFTPSFKSTHAEAPSIVATVKQRRKSMTPKGSATQNTILLRASSKSFVEKTWTSWLGFPLRITWRILYNGTIMEA